MQENPVSTKRREIQVFLFLTVVLFPVVAVSAVAAFGFIIWVWQMFNGPPGA